ncbi:hypothetical protein MTO96_004532 [Rhipicephalus appendiculatus]
MEQPLHKNRERYAGPLPLEMQWTAPAHWPAAPVDFWAQSATGQGYFDSSGNEEAEPSTSNRGVSAAESTWMRNVTRMLVFSVLLIALLVASLLLGRSSAWLAGHDEVTGHPDGHQHLSPLAVGVASGRSGGVGPRMRANSSRPLAAGTKNDAQRRLDTRSDSKETSIEETETTGALTSTAADMPHQASRKMTSRGAALCNRGANKFASLASCDAACGSNANTAEPKCHEKALFTECKSEDIKGPLWFSNGDRCERWNFWAGLCPATNESRESLFATSEECERSCYEPGSRSDRCGAPRNVACAADRLRQPYFANMAASGTAERCLKATAQNLAGHLCLAGKNRFSTLEACRKECVRSA